MPLTQRSSRHATGPQKAIARKDAAPSLNPPSSITPIYAIDEINAYIAIRDGLLAEAEELRTRAKLESVCIANDFVAGCLQPPRSPYEAQCLPEDDAARERKRCEDVKARIAKLRAHAS